MKFSIAIPAFKATYLKECIDSILCQSYSNFELIIINDHSPENLDEIVEKYNDARIRYYKNDKNIGAENVVDNWNKCLFLAKGNYFLLMGDDDKLAPNFLNEFYLRIQQAPNIDVFHCQTEIIDENNKTVSYTPDLPLTETFVDLAFERIINKRPQFISDFIFKTDALKKNGGFYKLPLAQMSDDLTVYKLSKNKGILNVPKRLLFYRRHASTISSTGNELLTTKAILMAYDWIDHEIENINSDSKYEYKYQVLRKNLKKTLVKKKSSVLIRLIKNQRKESFRKLLELKQKGYIRTYEIAISYVLFLKHAIVIFIKSKA